MKRVGVYFLSFRIDAASLQRKKASEMEAFMAMRMVINPQ